MCCVVMCGVALRPDCTGRWVWLLLAAKRTRPHTHFAVLCCALLVQSELASLQTTLAREQGAAQNATGRLAVLEASLAEQQVGV